MLEQLKNLFLYENPQDSSLVVAGRGLVYLFLVIWGFNFLTASMDSATLTDSFMHMVNLPFHEAGHLIFGIFGRTAGALGGTLGQLIMPLVCLSVFLIKMRNPFGAAVCLWWTAQNFMDIAPYINDARKQTLILLGGVTGRDAPGYHDWNFILSRFGWLEYDHQLALLSLWIGKILMVIMFIWGGYVLFQQARDLSGR